jgi:hypothetical protein
MNGLVRRGNERGIMIATTWMSSSNAAERIAAWDALYSCPTPAVLWRIITPQQAVRLYEAETNAWVRKEIEGCFGHHKARFAVDALCRTLAHPKIRPSETNAASTLGQIGDPRAVEPLILSRESPILIVCALGMISDEKGAGYIIGHLHLSGAPIALAHAGGPHSLSALQRELRRLDHIEQSQRFRRKDGYPRKKIDSVREQRDEVRLAILLLTSQDTQSALLDVLESHNYSLHARKLALQELARIGISQVRERFHAYYLSKMRSALGMECISVAAGDTSAEFTELMKSHLLALQALRSEEWEDPRMRMVKFLLAPMRSNGNRSNPVGIHVPPAISMLQNELNKRIGNEVFLLGH